MINQTELSISQRYSLLQKFQRCHWCSDVNHSTFLFEYLRRIEAMFENAKAQILKNKLKVNPGAKNLLYCKIHMSKEKNSPKK